MDKPIEGTDLEKIKEAIDEIYLKLDKLAEVVNVRIEKLKKIVGDYLELGANISMATVKANLKSV